MREITILSGKGGTGKTTVTAALASVAKQAVFCDNDVDAADLHLLLKPDVRQTHPFLYGWIMAIDPDKCSSCGLCADHCRFEAIHTDDRDNYHINPWQCEGCRLCERVCPELAISATINNNNQWFVSNTRFGSMVHARLSPGEENSGKLVAHIRKAAREEAAKQEARFILNDGPPGIGCSTISSITGTDLVLMVIEPTKSGFHDAVRLIDLIKSFNVKAYAIINKWDISPGISQKITEYLDETGIELLARLPFNKAMVDAMIQEQTIVEYKPESELAATIKHVWERISEDTIKKA